MDTTDFTTPGASEAVEGQVCDRCRQKKVRCDGAMPQCSNCAAAKVPCKVSAKLRRKTKIRGFSASNEHRVAIDRLETENSELRLRLKEEIEKSEAYHRELARTKDQLAVATRPAKLRKLADQSSVGPQSPVVSLAGDSEVSSQNRSAYIVKHMGRMVFDQAGVGKFAGSTTGVHFVASVEELCRGARPTLRAFPEDCFRVHIVQSQFTSEWYASRTVDGERSRLHSRIGTEPIRVLLDQSLEYYLKQLDIFNDMWLPNCPILPRNKFARDTDRALNFLQSGSALDGRTSSTVQILIMVMLINQLCFFRSHDTDEGAELIQTYFALSCRLHHMVAASADLESLQALILFSFYLQISGQTAWLNQVNGLLVRLAQSLGMHRHARRFRFTESETELRKRMWWWVYGFDKLTSIVHGLPKLINDADVDNDLPIDCELTDTDAHGLSHPLPGEPSPVLLFIHYIRISMILSTILHQLYTTSQRRGGEQKILRLDRDLRVWHQNFSTLHSSPHDITDVDKTLHKVRWQRCEDDVHFIVAWLDLMANFALVLIHRPALTFDSTTQRFKESLSICLKACSAIIQLGSTSNIHRRAMTSVPFGAALIFQSSLMPIFHQCILEDAGLSDNQVNMNKTLEDGVELLQSIEAEQSESILPIREASQVNSLLRTLSNSFASQSSADASHILTSQPEQQPFGGSIVVSYTESDEHIGSDFWSSSALESLNHLDVFYSNWDTSSSFAPANT